MTTVPIDHASADLREVAGAARDGQELVLTDNGKPVAQVVPLCPAAGSTRRLVDELSGLPRVDYAEMRRELDAVISPSL
ncbi:MAG: type II toxin-antitoxin system prevent-host-death family antitoxin [Propionibacteriaceae bacterium]|jgi:prevent-host-death family protein|nr:type II toxin-antitoxin system prevent-host-death family antitoxin [Propionibacteriaceae bacterium]